MQPKTAHDRRWWTLVVLSVSLLVISLDNTILNVALPTIERDLSASSGQLQWIVDSYTLIFAGLLLTLGALGDRFGRRLALVSGLVVFGAGSLISALATSADMLIVARGIMGIGGALIMPSTLSILTNVFPAEERPKAIGIWAAVAGLGVAIGPVSGGWLLEHFDWSSVFYVNLPVVTAALLASPILVPESRDPGKAKLDPLGAVLSTLGLGAVVWAIIEGGDSGFGDGMVVTAFGVGLALLAAFTAWELRSKNPMLDVRLFKVRRFSGASLSITLVFFSLFGAIFFLTTYLQGVMDLSALEAGVRVSPVAAGLVLGGPLSAKLAERLGTRRVVAAGLAVVAVALLLLAGLEVDSGYGIVAASLVLLGFGMGSTMAPATESIMSSLPLEHASVGSAMNDTVRMVGGTLGVAILGSLLSSGYGADMSRSVEGLSPGAASAASDSLGGASAVAAQIGGSAGHALDSAAELAFTSAMSSALIVAAGVALAGALIALFVLPEKERERAEKARFVAETQAAAA
ncbi:MAG TPA: DHA2 family efflux MFS transporter permease subunit [Thermoleophilaceae bacterium]|nr:DHA2 family efflux MFS transporter permease subunit [Thermoleophilaceae bacterium]